MGYWYLGTEYTKYSGGIHNGWLLAVRTAADLLKKGIIVYSPIVHTHPIAIYGQIDPLDHNIWLPADKPFMEAARGLIVYQSPGWRESYGISKEINYFLSAEKPVLYMPMGGAEYIRSQIDDLPPRR